MSRAASSLLFPELDFGIAANGAYPSEDVQRVLARIAFTNEFANTGAKAYQLACGDDIAVNTESRNPLARALFYHLRGLGADPVDAQFDHVRETIFAEAARNRVFTAQSTWRSTSMTGSITAARTQLVSVQLIPTKELTAHTSSPRSVSWIRASALPSLGHRWRVTTPTS